MRAACFLSLLLLVACGNEGESPAGTTSTGLSTGAIGGGGGGAGGAGGAGDGPCDPDGYWCTVLSSDDNSYPYGAVWGASPTEVFVGGNRVFHRWSAGQWSTQAIPDFVDQGNDPHRFQVKAMGGVSSSLVYLAGGDNSIGGVLVYDGASFSHDLWSWATFDIGDMLVVSSDDIWAVHDTQVRHWDGTSWSWLNFFDLLNPNHMGDVYYTTIRSVAATGDEVWLGAADGKAIRWAGTSRQNNTPEFENGFTLYDVGADLDLEAVWGAAADDVWLVGGDSFRRVGSIFRWDGQALAPVPHPALDKLTAAWGFSANDVWVSGLGGILLHWDGAQWTSEVSGITQGVGAVWAASKDDVWGTNFRFVYRHLAR